MQASLAKDENTAPSKEAGKISTSQRGYGELLESGRRLLAYVETLPDFAPADAELSPAGLRAFLQELGALNAQLESARAELRQARERRHQIYHGRGGLLERAVRLRDYAASLPDGRGGPTHAALRRLLRVMRPYPAAKRSGETTDPNGAEAADGGAPRARSRSELSFGALLERGREMEQVVRAMGEAAPAQGELSADALAELLRQIAAANATVARLETQAARLSAQRAEAFRHQRSGLAGVVSRVRSAIAAQYGRGSAEYGNLRKMRV
jgi:hypothetical protein